MKTKDDPDISNLSLWFHDFSQEWLP